MTQKKAKRALQEEALHLSEIIQLRREIALKSSSLEETMALIVERSQQLTHADGAAIEMLNGDELIRRSASGNAAPSVGQQLRGKACLSGHCLKIGQVLYCPDVATDPHVDLEACRRIGIQSMIVVPIQTPEGCQGVLKVSSSAPHTFTEKDVQALQLIADFLATSLRLASEFEAKNALLLALRDTEERYHSILEALAEGVTLQDASSTILASNTNAATILGLSPEQMMGRSSLDPQWQAIHEDGSLFPGEQHPTVVTLRTGKPCRNVIMGIPKPDNDLTWISVNSQPLFRPDEQNPYGVVASFSDITEQKWAEDALKKSEAELQALFAAMTDVVLVRDAEGRCLKVVSTNTQYLYRPVEELVGKTLHETFPAEQADAILGYIQQALARQQTVQGEYSVVDIEGRKITFSTNFSPISADAVVLVVRDISAQKQLEKALFEEKELAQVTLASIGDAVITTDAEGCIGYVNPAAEKLMGWNPLNTLGIPFDEVFKLLNKATGKPVENLLERALQKDYTNDLETVLVAADGREISIKESAAPICDRSGQKIGAVMIFQDVTQTRQLSQQLVWEASHDSLTRLVNRREFEQRVEEALADAQSQNQVHALCYLDLDQFRSINDNCGHAGGDELLLQLSAILQVQVRRSDTLARLGGDEFGLLFKECTLEQALRIANQIRECIQSFRFVWQAQAFSIGASIGLTEINAESTSVSDILSVADAACYTAKNRGRNRVHLFQANDLAVVQQRNDTQWISRLKRALEEDRFCLYYQPIFDVAASSQSEHYEVLLRLRDETGQLVPPMAFIPAAERYNLMHLIDRWVIKTLFKTQGAHYRDVWQRQCQQEGDIPSALYAINLSGDSINDDLFINFVYEQFALHSIPTHLICFEITETMAIVNLTKASQFIRELQAMGCRFALDDFGSGMSSFGYLKNLPVNYLKIDGSFIRNIVTDPVDAAMVKAMTQIGQVMGMKIVAEFVENDAILDCIKELGIDYAQGYGIAAPRPLT
ncbi:EAL domain-containing protein [Altericista sp. CCNU0014]|uniref:EAL domain-containing protein n=1 Tax=Altericista sp. CCNU0014 TaxID=3082949 RepID=UPI003850DB24